MKKILISLILISNLAHANCDKPVSYLTKGSPAPCTGYLFSPEQEKYARERVQEVEAYQKLVKQQDELIYVLQDRIDVKEKQVANLRSENEFLEKKTVWTNIMYFLIGAGTAVLINNQLRR